MNIDFALILTLATLISGLVALFDILFLAKKRGAKHGSMPWYSEYARSLFPIFLIVLIIRSFIAEPYRIPTGSLEPTLLVGDFILVSKYNYGLKLPVTNKKILQVGEPKRGDIVVFFWPPNKSYDLIKRVIGLPGDHIKYINKTIYVNDKPVQLKPVGGDLDSDGRGNTWVVNKFQEDLFGVKHDIFLNPAVPAFDFNNIVVPKGHYFVMGDNRDDSADSRYWGFVPEKNLVGKAIAVVFSWDQNAYNLRWKRTFSGIKGGI